MAIAGAVGALTFELSNFCTTDPPAMPTITADDVAALFQPADLLLFIPARQKFEDLVRNYLWTWACQCNSGPQPALPTPPSPVTTFDPAPTLSPPAMSGGQCLNVTRSFRIRAEPNYLSGGSAVYFFQQEFSSGQIFNVTQHISPAPPMPARPFPAGTTSTRLTIKTISGNPTPQSGVQVNYNSWTNSSSGHVILSQNIPTDGNTFQSAILPVTSGDPYFDMWWSTTASIDPVVEITLEVWCGSSAPTVIQPCCPPDPTLLQAVEIIRSYVELIQRQTSPFAYVKGVVHSGLTGSGHIAVQGLIGALVTMTAIPSNVGSELGDPIEYFEAGWINWGNSDGSSKREWLSVSPQTSFPPLAGQYTRIGYSLKPGVSIDITELSREP